LDLGELLVVPYQEPQFVEARFNVLRCFHGAARASWVISDRATGRNREVPAAHRAPRWAETRIAASWRARRTPRRGEARNRSTHGASGHSTDPPTARTPRCARR